MFTYADIIVIALIVKLLCCFYCYNKINYDLLNLTEQQCFDLTNKLNTCEELLETSTSKENELTSQIYNLG